MAFIQSEDKTKAMKQKKTNSKGESRCFNCGVDDNWSSECPHDKMSDNQRAEIAAGERNMLMNVEEEVEEQEGVNMMSVMILNNKTNKRNGLCDDRLYLDNCSTLTAVKNKAFLKNLRDTDQHLSISCNVGVTKTE